MAGVVEKLEIQNCINLTGNCEHYMYGLFGFAEKLNIQNWKIRRERSEERRVGKECRP